MKRIILSGILAGIAMFLWESLAHEVLPLGQAGIRGMTNESAVLAAIRQNVKEPGLYMFPWPEMSEGMSGEQKRQAMAKAMERARTEPTGLMVVQPGGAEYPMGRLLATQCGFDIAIMLIASFLVSWTMMLKGYASRVVFVTLLGLLPALAVDLPLWNWYRYPAAYTMAQWVEHVVGFFMGGLVVAAVVRPAR